MDSSTSTCWLVGSAPPASSSDWRNMIAPSCSQRSKWPNSICSLISDSSRMISSARALRHLDVEGAGQMQRLEILHPGEGDMIVGPASGDRDRDLVVAGPLEGPVIGVRDLLDDIHRVDFAGNVEFDQFHEMLPVVLGAPPRAPRKRHTTNNLVSNSGGQDMRRTSPGPDPAPGA